MRVPVVFSDGQVLMLAPRYWPAVGGVEKHIERIGTELLQRKMQVHIVTCKHDQSLKSSEQRAGIQIWRFPFGWERNPVLVFFWFLKNRHLISKSTLIHVHDTVTFMLWYLPLRFLYPNRPVYITFHGYEADPIPDIFRILRKIAARLTKKSICVGRFIEKMYRINCGRTVIGAVDSLEGHSSERNGVIFVGRLEQDTGVDIYLEAIQLLEKTHGIRLPFTVCGSGTCEWSLKEKAKELGIEAHFKGVVSNPTRILQSSKICLGGGYLATLEAQAAGVPVIVVAQTHLKQQYYLALKRMGSVLSIQTTPLGIAKEMAALMTDKSLSKRISATGQSFASQMTWKNLANEYLRLWDLDQ